MFEVAKLSFESFLCLLFGVTYLLLESDISGDDSVTEFFFLLAWKAAQPLPFRESFPRGFLAGRNDAVP